jgi:hypothetical protein
MPLVVMRCEPATPELVLHQCTDATLARNVPIMIHTMHASAYLHWGSFPMRVSNHSPPPAVAEHPID